MTTATSFDFAVETAEGATFTPWTDGYSVGFKVTAEGKPTRIVRFQPSSDTGMGIDHTNTFVYLSPEDEVDETTGEYSQCFVDIWDENS